jgi:molecular chaperone HtpG|nr:ATP-binding protein [uncultured Bacteroides sp.]
MEEINFKIELSRILDVLCNDLYDSPFALLRENVQNAYDAILMRIQKESFDNPMIKVGVSNDQITIEDNGIGMDVNTLKENYWTAGSSGKNNEEARNAGVVGTFGIGAMANFGVCARLEVITRAWNSEVTITSCVNKRELSLSEKSISINDQMNKLNDYGTTIIATLEAGKLSSINDAKEYLRPYVRFLDIPVYFNGEIISQQDYKIAHSGDDISKKDGITTILNYSFNYHLEFNNHNNVMPRIYINNIKQNGIPVNGDMCLKTGEPFLYGLRNGFGLAPIPISSVFNFGGIANLSFLTPTAGREAISRECINTVSIIYNQAEHITAEAISKSDIAENCREFLLYIRSHGSFNLADNIQIQIANSEKRLKLKDVEKEIGGKTVYFFAGSDKSVLKMYEGGECIVLIPSNDSTRRQIQLNVLRSKGIKDIPDKPMVIKVIDNEELDYNELAIIMRIRMVIESDYLLSACDVKYAEISHGLSMTIEKENSTVMIYITRTSSEILHIKQLYKDDYSVFEPFIKDLVRMNLYPKFAQYVPSSTRDGADALYAMLQRKKELYTIEYSEMGNMENIMKDYLEGKAGFNDVLRAAVVSKHFQTQMVDSKHVGDVADVVGATVGVANAIHEITAAKIETESQIILEPLPPIMRTSVTTNFKILKTEQISPILHNFQFFISLSDKMFKENFDFFLQPHTTKVIWSMHKIVYIFTHASSKLTLYYDMDLEQKLENDITGGRAISTTTIVSKNKIFVPIISEMNNYFDIKSGQRKFFVRYDSVRGE